jgi:hypothetical protein
MDIPRQTKELLKTLVRDYVAGRVLFSSQVPANIMGMVFMPLAMGALAYPVEEPELPKEPEKPVRGFTRPTRPEPDVEAVRPTLEASVVEARKALQDTEFRARWGEAGDSEVQAARASLEKAEEALRDALTAAERAADADHEVALTEYRSNLAAHRAAVAEWRAAVKAWREECEKLRPEREAWEAGRNAYFDKLKSELGVIYGYTKDAIGQRAINGFPMLSSCALLHREDWELVRNAIDRELDREIEL